MRLNTFEQCLMILGVASWIVPSRSRAEWRKEWEAELVNALQISRNRTYAPEVTGLRWRCCGAFVDAAWYRFNREQTHSLSQRLMRTPAFLLLALTGLVLVFFVASGDFPRMRSILMPPPYADPGQMVTISGSGVLDSSQWMVPYSWVRTWRQQGQPFTGLTAYSGKPQPITVTADGKQAKILSVRVEGSLFRCLVLSRS